MRNSHKNSGWILATAGMLALGAQGNGQTSPYYYRGSAAQGMPASPYPAGKLVAAPAPGRAALLKPAGAVKPAPTSAARPGEAGAMSPAPTPADSQARLAEMRVRIAWIADPLTCPCSLQARANGSMMEVKGEVPSKAAHERAVSLACAHGGLPIVDDVQLRKGSAFPTRSVSIDQLLQGSLDALSKDLARVIHNFNVQAHPNGQVTISGTIPSQEEKLAVSQRLRQVIGCTRVDNQLEVWKFPHEGHAQFLVSADGRHVLPADSVQGQAHPGTSNPVNADSFLVKAPPAQGIQKVESRTVIPTAALAQPATDLRAGAERTSSCSCAASAQEPSFTISAEPSRTSRLADQFQSWKAKRRLSHMQAASAARGELAPVTVVVAEQPKQMSSSPPANPTATVAGAKQAGQLAAPALFPASTTVAAPNAIRSTPYNPAVHQSLYHEKKAAPAHGTVGAGVIVLANTEETYRMAPQIASDHLKGWLKQRVEKECVPEGKDVEVELRSNSSVSVSMKVQDPLTAQRFAQKIFRMPELEPYHVLLNIQVVP